MRITGHLRRNIVNFATARYYAAKMETPRAGPKSAFHSCSFLTTYVTVDLVGLRHQIVKLDAFQFSLNELETVDMRLQIHVVVYHQFSETWVVNLET